MLKKSILTALVILLSLTPASYALGPTTEASIDNADVASSSLFATYWVPSRRDFGANNYWFYAHSIDIAAMAFARTPKAENLRRLNDIVSAERERGFLQGEHVFFDDEAWMAISLARVHALTGDTRSLNDSVELLEDILKRGREGRENGVWWNSEHQKVATASNIAPVIAGALLWKLTKNPAYLAFAKKNYRFWYETMVNLQTFQVNDQIFGNGEIDTTAFSYDQGLMIGAAVELFRITGEEKFLRDARNLSSYMLTRMVSQGVMVEELCLTRRQDCLGWKDVAMFKGIAVRYLVELLKVDPLNADLRNYLSKTSAMIMSPEVFDSFSGKFAYEWDGSVNPSVGSYQTANSAVLAVSAFATLTTDVRAGLRQAGHVCREDIKDFGF